MCLAEGKQRVINSQLEAKLGCPVSKRNDNFRFCNLPRILRSNFSIIIWLNLVHVDSSTTSKNNQNNLLYTRRESRAVSAHRKTRRAAFISVPYPKRVEITVTINQTMNKTPVAYSIGINKE